MVVAIARLFRGLLEFVRAIVRALRQPAVFPPLTVHLTVDKPEEQKPVTTNLTTTQQTTIHVSAITDRRGHPAPVDGAPQWSTDRPDLLSLFPSDDGMHCGVVATGETGSASVTATVDALIGEGVVSVGQTTNFVIAPAMAANVALSVDEPTEIPTDQLPSGFTAPTAPAEPEPATFGEPLAGPTNTE